MACWREQADNVAASLQKGDPVIVVGKLASHQYVRGEENRINFEITAQSVGPDLSRGSATFTKRRRMSGSSMPADADGLPAMYEDESYVAEGDPFGGELVGAGHASAQAG
ncbi:single-stranded DNA-binding protein [Jatrophihabitans telluris]|uniref:Single-stranded DNA-binding protein n=1 Tax=Jatrophihabitans telluris TaxID=2038343 RepID=A0ABY4R150_9ACTN|nr:single-stranded DNA-binding protein [Jatrophihabitans telluris]UQX89636.1 single-stranded DNA-binding protein [Jatrophihabitans telluris]